MRRVITSLLPSIYQTILWRNGITLFFNWRVLVFTFVFGTRAIDIDLETYIGGKLFEPVDSRAEVQKTHGIDSSDWNHHKNNKGGLQLYVQSRIIQPCEDIQNGYYKIRLAGHKFQYLSWKKEKLTIQRKSLQTFARSWRIYTLERNDHGVSPILMQSANKPKAVGDYAQHEILENFEKLCPGAMKTDTSIFKCLACIPGSVYSRTIASYFLQNLKLLLKCYEKNSQDNIPIQILHHLKSMMTEQIPTKH